MAIKTHKFGDRVFRIEEHGVCGQVTTPDPPGKPPRPELMVDHRLKGLAQLETWVHEAMHAANPRLSEAVVTRDAHDIARLLWRLGYRRTEK